MRWCDTGLNERRRTGLLATRWLRMLLGLNSILNDATAALLSMVANDMPHVAYMSTQHAAQ
jgi:hypothetical protein